MDRAEYVRQVHAQSGVPQADIVSLVQHATGRTVSATHRLVSGDECEIHRVELTDGSTVYLRVSFPGTKHTKIAHEAWAMTRARGGGVPVPVVHATDTITTDDGERTAMVLSAAPGRQLRDVLPTLCSEDRTTVMTEVGRVLRTLHSISMPGGGVPDHRGEWVDPEKSHRGYVEDSLAACAHLATAGLAAHEIDGVVRVLECPVDAPNSPVLCHGDLTPEHVFIDRDLRVTGIIDWGMWHAATAESELAGISLTSTAADFNAILAGHGGMHSDQEFQLTWHAMAKATRTVAWLVTSGQFGELPRATSALRNVLTTTNAVAPDGW